jgi:hypothetical protein
MREARERGMGEKAMTAERKTSSCLKTLDIATLQMSELN